MNKNNYDAVVVGAGPNGLAAGIVLQQAGISTLIIEGSNTIGGGVRSSELTLPGFVHDICSSIYPFGVGSLFLGQLPLRDFGLKWIFPEAAVAHPFDDGRAILLRKSVAETAEQFGNGAVGYKKLMEKIVADWDDIGGDFLGPLTFPKHPAKYINFGLKAIQPATVLAKRYLKDPYSRALLAGIIGHAILPLENMASSGLGLVLGALGHKNGWPFPEGGAQQLANAMAAYFKHLGGEIQTNMWINSMEELPPHKAVLFDTTPRHLLYMKGLKFPYLYKKQLQRFKYGQGVFKMDWALSDPIPFTAKNCLQSATMHLGGTMEEIALSERLAWEGKHAEKPFVLLVHQTLLDKTRAPEGKHTAWAYCHVPHGSTKNMTEVIENQVERFAPGFRQTILARHTMNAMEMQQHNPNYIGGDIIGGAVNLRQLFTRPSVRISPYSTPVKGIYLCSSSTPPSGGVHGMCGYHAAKKAIQDLFTDAK